MINVEVCYALPQESYSRLLTVAKGCTVIKAILASGLLDHFPHLNLDKNVGIFSQRVALDHLLNEGDRVEIYRPLVLTPNESRLLRAKNTRTK